MPARSGRDGLLHIVGQIRGDSALMAVLERCDEQTNASFDKLVALLPGGANYNEFVALVEKVRSNVTFHYQCDKLINKAITRLTNTPGHRSSSITRGDNVRLWHFQLADVVLDTIVVRELWQVPDNVLKGQGADEAAWRTHEMSPSWTSAASSSGNTVSDRSPRKCSGWHDSDLRSHMPGGMDFRKWAGDVSAWLFGTEHIGVSYGVQYDGVEIEQLSPGTRGIVLLLLYLAIDAEDDRPLLIDQPEENLDPQSVFEELVVHFRAAKKRRQIIIVTHNANLVVNTDSDQVIVAQSGAHRPGELPVMTYQSGGLENPVIRKFVCEILEGGERAFKERAKRLRVTL